MMKKHYIDTRFGQVHLRTLRLGLQDQPPLILLHPMPYSGLYFTTVMPMLDTERTIIAVDYPGCGQSDDLPSTPTIEDYSMAVLDALSGLGVESKCDFLGFHTGCLVAAEIAIVQPSRVASIVLIDIPYFDEAKRSAISESMTTHKALTEDLSCLQKHWDSDVKTRLGMMPLTRAFELFTDHINAQGDGAEGFKAAFRYPVEEKFAALDCATLVVATKSGLYDGTLAAAKLIQGSRLIELTEINRAAFEEGAAQLAQTTNDWLTTSA